MGAVKLPTTQINKNFKNWLSTDLTKINTRRSSSGRGKIILIMSMIMQEETKIVKKKGKYVRVIV